MRHAIFVAFLLCIAGSVAQAQDSAPPKQADTPPTRIEVDQDTNVIRFFINGDERAVLDAEGLHVKGNIDYSGVAIDGNKYAEPSDGGQASP